MYDPTEENGFRSDYPRLQEGSMVTVSVLDKFNVCAESMTLMGLAFPNGAALHKKNLLMYADIASDDAYQHLSINHIDIAAFLKKVLIAYHNGAAMSWDMMDTDFYVNIDDEREYLEATLDNFFKILEQLVQDAQNGVL